MPLIYHFQLILEHEKELASLKEKSVFGMDKKELELNQLHQKELEQLNSNHIEAVELYQEKYRILLDNSKKRNLLQGQQR